MATETQTQTSADGAAAAQPPSISVAKISNEPGTLGNLTDEEQVKLQQAWVHLFRLGGFAEKLKENKTPDLTSHFKTTLANKDEANFRRRLWYGILADHPDVLILRFLRARKWDVQKSMDMFVSALNWRDERKIDETVVKVGEDALLKEDMSNDDKGFLMQYRSGKSYVRGIDKEDRPVYVIKVRLHDPKAQSPESMEAFTLHGVESIRLLVKSPLDKCCLLFDMTGFGLKNMDFHVVKFLVHVFEARYPETLGVVLIHNAPFVFWGIWSIIKGWLDPVIAAKINFTRSNNDLAKFINKNQLQKEYGGEDQWEYLYVEPQKGDQDHLSLTEEKNAEIQKRRDALMADFEAATEEWVGVDPTTEQAKEIETKRNKLADDLRLNYFELDPYVRARTYYHRVNVVDDEGNVDFQGAGKEKKAAQ